MRKLRSEAEIMKHWKGDISQPVVSILCTTYNHEPYIEDALEGFLIQDTDFPFQIIIHDDASTDRTADIIREYVAAYPNLFRPVLQKVNLYSRGLSRDEFIEPLLLGEYVARCEGDDYWIDKDKLQRQVSFLKNNPAVNVSFHPTIKIDPDGVSTTTHVLCETDIIVSPQEYAKFNFAHMPTASLVFRRMAMRKIDERAGGIHLMMSLRQFLLVIDGVGGGFVAKAMTVYRSGVPGSWTARHQQSDEKFIETFGKIFKSIFEVMKISHKEYHCWLKRRGNSWFVRALGRGFKTSENEKLFYNKNKEFMTSTQKILWIFKPIFLWVRKYKISRVKKFFKFRS
jgi:glycosyltransferase involved in cell wall biosynthesis